jgi:hypothetical protein
MIFNNKSLVKIWNHINSIENDIKKLQIKMAELELERKIRTEIEENLGLNKHSKNRVFWS